MRKMPLVRECMSRLPEEVARVDTVARALAVMEKHGIHHLPVMEGYHLFGIVSWDSLQRARLDRKAAAGDLRVEDACTRDVLTIGPVEKAVDAAIENKVIDRRIPDE